MYRCSYYYYHHDPYYYHLLLGVLSLALSLSLTPSLSHIYIYIVTCLLFSSLLFSFITLLSPLLSDFLFSSPLLSSLLLSSLLFFLRVPTSGELSSWNGFLTATTSAYTNNNHGQPIIMRESFLVCQTRDARQSKSSPTSKWHLATKHKSMVALRLGCCRPPDTSGRPPPIPRQSIWGRSLQIMGPPNNSGRPPPRSLLGCCRPPKPRQRMTQLGT